MPFSRTTFGAIEAARTSISGARVQLTRLTVRRGYSSSQGSNASKPRGNLQWAVGATAVTIPLCWYLLKSTPQKTHYLHHSQKPEEPQERLNKESPKERFQERSQYPPNTDAKPTRRSQDNRIGVTKGTKDDEPQDKAAASKSPGDLTTQSGKQEKLSNDDTRHSTYVGKDSPQSQKGVNTPESAKLKGTVDIGKPEKQ